MYLITNMICNLITSGKVHQRSQHLKSHSLIRFKNIRNQNVECRSFFGLIAGSFAINYINGTCPDITPQSPVDLNQIAGDWWAILRDDKSSDLTGKCISNHFGRPVEGVARVVFTGISKKTNVASLIESDVTVSADNILQFYIHLPGWGGSEENQIVLDLNPDRYAIVYSCKNYQNKYFERFWVFARNKHDYGYFTNKQYLMQVSDSYGLRNPNWARVDNGNCC